MECETALCTLPSLQVATVPSQYILSDQLSPSFCPGILGSKALQAIYADEENSWEIKIGAALLWAVHQVRGRKREEEEEGNPAVKGSAVLSDCKQVC
eukprot:scaffold280912_cov18-Tisochrysis_lutea.AAC.3